MKQQKYVKENGELKGKVENEKINIQIEHVWEQDGLAIIDAEILQKIRSQSYGGGIAYKKLHNIRRKNFIQRNGGNAEHHADHEQQHHGEHAHHVSHRFAHIQSGQFGYAQSAGPHGHKAGCKIVNASHENSSECNPQEN